MGIVRGAREHIEVEADEAGEASEVGHFTNDSDPNKLTEALLHNRLPWVRLYGCHRTRTRCWEDRRRRREAGNVPHTAQGQLLRRSRTAECAVATRVVPGRSMRLPVP
jgi:hypothetical protein